MEDGLATSPSECSSKLFTLMPSITLPMMGSVFSYIHTQVHTPLRVNFHGNSECSKMVRKHKILHGHVLEVHADGGCEEAGELGVHGREQGCGQVEFRTCSLEAWTGSLLNLNNPLMDYIGKKGSVTK